MIFGLTPIRIGEQFLIMYSDKSFIVPDFGTSWIYIDGGIWLQVFG